ncbi:MAG: 4-(cytidine 5'-diphospho)-2-C-methyl-D-erythritol kinase [Acidobacteria bacterium]|nr:4-(cytidine 5'-diphospho)-2-C-methyl-D-erythritol kinase [Acidobacteriota bacterium]
MSSKFFSIPSFAKINLSLRILGKRNDGFHELSTIFQTISLHDNLTFSEDSELILTSDTKKIPLDERNLIIKAAKLLKEKYGIKMGAKINLEKNIPAPGGLGGGSSNAAIALLGLSKLWEIEIDFVNLLELGELLGSDVPFFFYGGTAIGTGRGTKIFPRQEINERNMLIVTPAVDVSTADAFGGLNATHLTNNSSKTILQICRYEAELMLLQQSSMKNDFEEIVFKLEPEIERVKKSLISSGAKTALMSGSGASVLAIFENEVRLQSALYNLKTERDWRVFPVKTVSHPIYIESLKYFDSLLQKDC